MKLSAVTTAIDLEYVEDVHCQASLPTSSQNCCQYANTTSQHCHLSESLNCDADTWHHKSLRMLHTTLPLCCSMKCTFVSLKYYVSQHRSKHELLMTWASFRLKPLHSESVKTSSKVFCFCSHSEPINDCMNEVPRFLQSILNANWSLCLRYPTNLPNEDHDCWVGFFRSQANVLTAYWMSNLSWLKYMAIPTIDTLTPLTLTTVRKDVRMLE